MCLDVSYPSFSPSRPPTSAHQRLQTFSVVLGSVRYLSDFYAVTIDPNGQKIADLEEPNRNTSPSDFLFDRFAGVNYLDHQFSFPPGLCPMLAP